MDYIYYFPLGKKRLIRATWSAWFFASHMAFCLFPPADNTHISFSPDHGCEAGLIHFLKIWLWERKSPGKGKRGTLGEKSIFQNSWQLSCHISAQDCNFLLCSIQILIGWGNVWPTSFKGKLIWCQRSGDSKGQLACPYAPVSHVAFNNIRSHYIKVPCLCFSNRKLIYPSFDRSIELSKWRLIICLSV